MSEPSSPLDQAVSHKRIVQKSHGGDISAVCQAQDSLRRFVALKILPDNVTNDPQALAGFVPKVRAASAFDQPKFPQPRSSPLSSCLRALEEEADGNESSC